MTSPFNLSPPGNASLRRLYRGQHKSGPGTLFLDFDDVICTSQPYGGYDLFDMTEERPPDLFDRLWHAPATQTLLTIVEEHAPRIVLTTSWLMMMDRRESFEALFTRTRLEPVARALHEHWEAPALRGMTRLGAIERWLQAHYEGESLVVLDDEVSGTGLKGSKLDRAGYVVLCEKNVGLHAGHLPQVRKALTGAGNA